MAFAARNASLPAEENNVLGAKDVKAAGKAGQSLLQQGSKRR